MTDRCLILGDTHLPYVNKSAITKVLDQIIPALRPTIIVQCGDLYDFYSFSKFPRSQNITPPGVEILNGRACAEEIWSAINRRSPKSKKYQLLGNDDTRINHRMMEKYPEIETLVNINHLWEFKGVQTIIDYREELILEINGHQVVFMHGFRSQLGSHAKNNLFSTVVGHSHRGGCVYFPIYNPMTKLHKTLFELNAGYLGDVTSKVMGYTSQKISNWTLGVGVIDEHGPRFIPF